MKSLGQSSAGAVRSSAVRIWRSPLAWQVTLFMGLQSLLYYVLISWFSVILGERGMTPGHAGWILSLMQLAQLPFTFFVPLWAGRMKNQRLLVVITFVLFIIGILGVWLGRTELMALWAICIGIGGGFAFWLGDDVLQPAHPDSAGSKRAVRHGPVSRIFAGSGGTRIVRPAA
ncbi:hypothetical protein ACFTAO_13705 [Paenibacillus rhizoplanae]